MTRADVLAQYRPIRSGIQRVLREAVRACDRPDLVRAVRQVAPWAEEADLAGEQAADMLADVALFEPNGRGRRAYDRFLAGRASRLDAEDRVLAERMGAAWFSLFRVADRHPAAGVWLEDLLADDRRLCLVDEAFEGSAAEGVIVGLRVFDAGPFHAGFGIVTRPDADAVAFCLAARAEGRPPPFRHSLAATLYGDQLLAQAPFDPADLALLQTFRALRPMAGGLRAGAVSRAAPRRRSRPRVG